LSEHVSTANAEPVESIPQRKREISRQNRPKQQPRYSVLLWDDDDHSYDYVIEMMKKIFGYPVEKGFQLAKELDTSGRVICLTTTLEHAELKRDQIHAFGKDGLIPYCKGAMSATLEAER